MAPDFQLPSSTGTGFHLFGVLQRSAVVLFFYLKAFTPVCTAEMCAFRDHAQSFEAANGAVFGVSSDRAPVANRFASFYQFPFPLLVDSDGRVRKLYGVRKALGILPGRVTFVIGRDRVIRQVTRAEFQSTPHVVESLRALQE